jgi:pimeloyl-ACP methyl ester carboxylesterase
VDHDRGGVLVRATVDSSHETTIWVESGGEQLFGIVTDPAPGTAGDVGVVLLTGGGWMPSTHRNRMYVDLARDLAALSCSTVRIDYRGVGESTGETGVFDFMQPHTGDALAAARALVQRGSRRIVLVGTCYGGRTALAAARHVPELVGLVLSGVPVIDYGGASESITSHVRRGWSLQTLKNLPSRYPKYLRILRSKARSLVGGKG